MMNVLKNDPFKVEEKNQILFAKINDSAIIPTKKDEDAGWDVYACFEDDEVWIRPNKSVAIPTGIASAFSSQYVAIIKERSSTGSKGIGVRAGIVDSGYRGEWKVILTNHTDHPICISKRFTEVVNRGEVVFYPYTKAIAQCLLLWVPQFEAKVVSFEELKSYESERGEGGFGSSGK